MVFAVVTTTVVLLSGCGGNPGAGATRARPTETVTVTVTPAPVKAGSPSLMPDEGCNLRCKISRNVAARRDLLGANAVVYKRAALTCATAPMSFLATTYGGGSGDVLEISQGYAERAIMNFNTRASGCTNGLLLRKGHKALPPSTALEGQMVVLGQGYIEALITVIRIQTHAKATFGTPPNGEKWAVMEVRICIGRYFHPEGLLSVTKQFAVVGPHGTTVSSMDHFTGPNPNQIPSGECWSGALWFSWPKNQKIVKVELKTVSGPMYWIPSQALQ
ncbi:MAG TPA: hypothetical protein VE975_05470 [Actinomycetota bacterium]|nr:hypothetical protein [Actinomycetota bacterium]